MAEKRLALFLLGLVGALAFLGFPKLPQNSFHRRAIHLSSHPQYAHKSFGPTRHSILRASIDDVSIDASTSAPDQSKFISFYAANVPNGEEISKEVMMKYDVVTTMMAEGLIYEDDIDELWGSSVGDATGLNQEEAYELLCMICDLPDPEDIAFYDEAFEKLAAGKDVITFFDTLNWDDIKEMIGEKALSMEEFSDVWRSVGGDLDAKLTRAQFSKLNKEIDDIIELKDEEEDETLASAEAVPSTDKPSIATNVTDTTSATTTDSSDINVWDPDFDPLSVFDDESFQDITDYFVSKAGSLAGAFTYEHLEEWPDTEEMLSDGALTPDALQVAWQEASGGKPSINYNQFLRLNVRLDLLMDEIEAEAEAKPDEPASPPRSTPIAPVPPATPEADVEDDTEQYYRDEFESVTQGGPLMRLDMLLEWKEVAELIRDGAVTESQITKLFEGMPREPMGIPTTAYGINADTFIAFNSMLDVLLDASAPAAANAAAPRSAETPAALVSEPPRPMPSGATELKMGSMGGGEGGGGGGGGGATTAAAMGDAAQDKADTGLSGKELELMEMLDQADNMLNSGSFGDFDQMIGDMNDPRLQALREERDGAEEVDGQLREIVDELLALGRQQQRCGLDKPSEEDAARLRDLIQGVIERAPPLAQAKETEAIQAAITGKWKLLYSNSEMFDFYNGVTGFANVFPASKFMDLSVEYTTDGYLTESRYFERLSSPLGTVDATVYGNWDLVKEMSFMTNANSVVLRNYCTKVTAGPMEYEAQENWKSLRTLSMNEIVYVDDRIKIGRNCGALRIYFLFEKE